jgi:hypothetical protein
VYTEEPVLFLNTSQSDLLVSQFLEQRRTLRSVQVNLRARVHLLTQLQSSFVLDSRSKGVERERERKEGEEGGRECGGREEGRGRREGGREGRREGGR